MPAEACERELSEALAQLSRHELRRARGIPAVSVLIGNADQAFELWNLWSRSRQQSVLCTASANVRALAAQWIEHLSRQRDLREDAAVWVAARKGSTTGALCGRLAAQGPLERTLWLSQALPPNGGIDAAAVCRILLESDHGAPEPLMARVGRFEAVERLVGPLSQIVPSAALPTLMVATEEQSPGPEWVATAANALAQLLDAAPRIPAALILNQEAFSAWLREPVESRSKALLRQGIVIVPNAPHPATHHAALDLDQVQLTAHSADGDQARSAAERFLFEMLEACPETAGLFELNGRLDFAFGGSHAMEIDLGSRALRVAVEIDGYYHFLDPEAYRRDRRKDLELQQRGWLVLRFLADDVVPRQEEILRTIIHSVRERRQHLGGNAD